MNQLETPVEMLDDGGTTIDPVAAIGVDQTTDVANRRPMDVPTNDAIQTALARCLDGRVFEIENELHRFFHTAFGIAGQGPLAVQAETATHQRED